MSGCRVPRWLLLTLAALSGSASAHELQALTCEREGARYRVSMTVVIEAPAAQAYAIFSNPDELPRINPAVREARVLQPAEDGDPQRLLTRLRLCAGPFCRELRQVQDMRYRQDGTGFRIDAEIIPALSDLRYGRAQWELRDCHARTCLQFHAELEPAFWVPPLVGPWLIEKTLREQAVRTSAGIEQRTRERYAPAP